MIKEILEGSKVRDVILNEAWVNWKDARGLEVVTTDSEGRLDTELYDTLEDARKDHPTLDPESNTDEFTWAMRGSDNRMRFEDWATNKKMSV